MRVVRTDTDTDRIRMLLLLLLLMMMMTPAVMLAMVWIVVFRHGRRSFVWFWF